MLLEEEIDKRVLNPDNTELARSDRFSQLSQLPANGIVQEHRVSMYNDPVRFFHTSVAASAHFLYRLQDHFNLSKCRGRSARYK